MTGGPARDTLNRMEATPVEVRLVRPEDLAALLAIENWAIDAIQNKIIDAKIDQQKEEIVIKSHMLRELKKKEWQSIQVKI